MTEALSTNEAPLVSRRSCNHRERVGQLAKSEPEKLSKEEAPEKITLGGSRASHQAVAELKAESVLPAQTLVRTGKYLNNMIEQDHRTMKQRCYPMLGFKTSGNAQVTLSGIELANKIKKGQFDTSEITGPGTMVLHV
jgi:transposase-like protein